MQPIDPASLRTDFDSAKQWAARALCSCVFLDPQGPPTYSPFPADLALDPVNSHLVYRASLYHPFAPFIAATIQTTEPLAHLRRDFEMGGLRLSDFEVRQQALP